MNINTYIYIYINITVSVPHLDITGERSAPIPDPENHYRFKLHSKRSISKHFARGPMV